MNEQYYDALLNIKTTENKGDLIIHFITYRYEPTPYSALETLFTQYELISVIELSDFGVEKEG